jgi:hypothetical protein
MYLEERGIESHPMNAVYTRSTFVFVIMMSSLVLTAQSVGEIITDYNGYFKTGTANVNAVKPDNNHNLLAFSFNGVRYSTGVNDALLTSNNETFIPANFRALPMNNITGAPTSNTKIGLGAMADGVINGAGAAPSRNLSQYLNDGVNGLGLGTCVANLPAGTMFMSVSNLQAAHIGDGIPDILVTQIADPSTQFDRYAFTDVNGNMVGNYMDINLTNITPVGQWVADFYEATGPTTLGSGFTQTQRNVRLWAADFSAFGINASNISNIAYFRINLSGDSDIAFVAYNTTTVTVQQVLAMPNTPRQTLSRNDNNEIKSSLKVYPNPAVGEVNFSHPVARGGEKIMIYNISGVLIMQQTVTARASQAKLNINGLRTGSYQVVYTNGIEKFSEKLIVR